MTCLNDIDERIIRNEFIVDLLLLLENDYQSAFYGFYVRYLNFSLKFFKIENKADKNLKKLISIFYRMSWLPMYFKRFTDKLELFNFNNFERLVTLICNYLTEFNPFSINNKISESELEKKKDFYRINAKVLLIDNINVI
jgi:hypothetical protein